MNLLSLKFLLTLVFSAAGIAAAQTSALTFPPVQHVNSSLSAAIDETWASLHQLGYVGSVEALTTEGVSYLFSKGAQQLEVTFTQQDGGILVAARGGAEQLADSQ